MKISIDIDCTPDEARRFFGLPDIAPLQEAFVAAMRARMDETLAGMDGEALLKTWMPQGLAAWEQWQKMWRDAAAQPKAQTTRKPK